MAEKKWLSIRLDEDDARIIERASTVNQESFSAQGRQVLAHGLRHIMIESGVSPESLRYLTADGIFDEYVKFEDATATKGGVAGPLGNVHRFESTPDGDVILHEREILVNGEIYMKGVRSV